MNLGGDPITGDEALAMGLVSRVYQTREELMEATMRMATKIASKPLMATSYTKRSIKHSLEVGESAAIAHERSLTIAIMATKDKKEGMEAFM